MKLFFQVFGIAMLLLGGYLFAKNSRKYTKAALCLVGASFAGYLESYIVASAVAALAVAIIFVPNDKLPEILK